MKIIGKTLEGDLIIQVSQAEWDGLGDGVRPKDDYESRYKLWPKTEAGQLIDNNYRLCPNWHRIRYAFCRGQLDGSLQSLNDIASGKIKLNYFGKITRIKLKEFLGNHTAQTQEKP